MLTILAMSGCNNSSVITNTCTYYIPYLILSLHTVYRGGATFGQGDPNLFGEKLYYLGIWLKLFIIFYIFILDVEPRLICMLTSEPLNEWKFWLRHCLYILNYDISNTEYYFYSNGSFNTINQTVDNLIDYSVLSFCSEGLLKSLPEIRDRQN